MEEIRGEYWMFKLGLRIVFKAKNYPNIWIIKILLRTINRSSF
jgi:hypothetical protein